MGIHVIKVPDIGEGIAEVELVEWHVQPGDSVTEDQGLADVMTDKANVEIPTPVAGKVIALGGKPGDTLAVGSELIRLEVDGAGNVASSAAPPAEAPSPAAQAAATARIEPEVPRTDSKAAAAAPSKPAAAAAAPPTASPAQTSNAKTSNARAKPHIPASAVSGKGKGEAQPAAVSGGSGSHTDGMTAAPGAHASAVPQDRAQDGAARPLGSRGGGGADDSRHALAAPAVRERASRLGIDLGALRGSGPGGRVTHDDLDAHLVRGNGAHAEAATRSAEPAARDSAGDSSAERNDEETVPVIGLRRKIAHKMQEAKRRIPHFTYVEEVDVTELEALRGALNEKWGATRGKLTLLPFLMRAIVRALPEFPQINARYDDDAGTLTRYGAVHLGIATQTDGGLVVPVVRHAEARDLWACAAEVARLADAARAGKATREELSGSTLTITSLGPLGGIVTTPVINHPEVAIVGVNRIVERPVIRNGAVVPRLMMNLSSSFDHRVVDGMDGARFVQALRRSLEAPATLFIQ